MMSRDRRIKRDRHALNEDGMVLCNPRDREAAHRAQMEGIATDDRAQVNCRKCRRMLHHLDRGRQGRIPGLIGRRGQTQPRRAQFG
jgi:hypothetical protein